MANSATGELNFTKPISISEENLFNDLAKLGYPKVAEESDDTHGHDHEHGHSHSHHHADGHIHDGSGTSKPGS